MLVDGTSVVGFLLDTCLKSKKWEGILLVTEICEARGKGEGGVIKNGQENLMHDVTE
jgi:hypothetical protein